MIRVIQLSVPYASIYKYNIFLKTTKCLFWILLLADSSSHFITTNKTILPLTLLDTRKCKGALREMDYMSGLKTQVPGIAYAFFRDVYPT
jgi:hypothetical protein